MPQEPGTDLRPQLGGLERNLVGDVVFQHIRTGRNLITIYSMETGEPIPIPEYMLRAALSKRLADGTPMFTQNMVEAPEYRRGMVKCFLHRESAERQSGVLDEIGLGGKFCPSDGLASTYAKRMHGQHRHSKEWEAYQEYVKDQKEKAQEDRQQQQIDATLELAKTSSSRRTVERKKTDDDNGAGPT